MRRKPGKVRVDIAIMHDKYLIVDSKTVETGSFYTASAEHRNAENVLIIHNNRKLAKQYETHWLKL